MPLYFFNLREGQKLSLDDTGTEFADLDLAYLDAFRAAGEIWLEMASHGQDGSTQSFEITDTVGRLLVELPFSEILHARARSKPRLSPESQMSASYAAKAKSRALAEDLARLVAVAQQTMEQTHFVLRRSRSQT